MKTIKIFSLIAVLSLFNNFLIAQGKRSIPAKSVLLHLEVENPDKVTIDVDDPDVDMEAILESINHNVKVTVNLFSTGNISKIHVKVGMEPTSSDFAEYTFEFDPKEVSDSNFTYDRAGKTIVLGLGQIRGVKDLHAEVTLENGQGEISSPKYSNDF